VCVCHALGLCGALRDNTAIFSSVWPADLKVWRSVGDGGGACVTLLNNNRRGDVDVKRGTNSKIIVNNASRAASSTEIKPPNADH
jgi:hypothetical protein